MFAKEVPPQSYLVDFTLYISLCRVYLYTKSVFYTVIALDMVAGVAHA
jgi:hypothetical protein